MIPQLTRSEARGDRIRTVNFRGLLVLLGIGLAHALLLRIAPMAAA